MTLKEKIKDVDIEKGMSDRIEQIADDYAIEFAEWVGKNTLTYYDGKFRMKTLTPVFLTSEELLERFKKEKGL